MEIARPENEPKPSLSSYSLRDAIRSSGSSNLVWNPSRVEPFSCGSAPALLESICTCPAVMTHGNMLVEDRLKVGITDGFVRLSCGRVV